MDKKPSNVKYVIRLTTILVFFAVMLFPLTLMALDGPDETAMESESATELVSFNLTSWFDRTAKGSFQNNFEKWFSAHYPLRSNIVTAFRQMQFDLENNATVIQIMDFLKGNTVQTPPQFLGVIKPGMAPGTVLPDPDGGSSGEGSGDDGGDGEGGGTTTTPPVNIYLDPNNIYADINRLQMLEVPVEPSGFQGNNSVWIGKSGYLFEAAYINEYMGYTAPYTTATDEGLQETVDKLEYIQEELAKRGITMLYIISSSKASQYSDFIPDHYKDKYTTAEGYVRPIERLREMLAKSSINYLDSSEYFKEIGLLVTFPKTGIHWNGIASFEATAELIRMYQRITGKTTVTLDTKGVRISTTPFSEGSSEQDVYNILYGAIGGEGIKDNAYYSPDIVITNEDAPKLNILIQGGSFTHSINYFLRKCNVGTVTFNYYNGYNGSETFPISPFEAGPEAWGTLLQGKDLVIFEATEQQIRGGHKSAGQSWATAANDGNIGHNAVYDSLYEYLKAHEGEY